MSIAATKRRKKKNMVLKEEMRITTLIQFGLKLEVS